MAETRRVILTDQALSDVEAIAEYIHQDSPPNAASVAQSILDAIDSLATMSHRFRRAGTSRKRKSPVHAMLVRPFIIYYRIDLQAIHILTVLHGARRQPKRFK